MRGWSIDRPRVRLDCMDVAEWARDQTERPRIDHSSEE